MEKSNNVELEHFIAPLREQTLSLPQGYTSPPAHGQHDTFTTVREGTHRGKKFEIHTTYRILIDGEPFLVHTGVLNNGTVHSHSFPQYSFPSAVDLVRKVIDASDRVELPEDELGRDHTHPHHS
jgi:hypothetical protein